LKNPPCLPVFGTADSVSATDQRFFYPTDLCMSAIDEKGILLDFK
jgi:hypothetical protein